MKSYELKPCEVDLVLIALRFTTEHGYTYEHDTKGDLSDYHDMHALIRKLDPKPVQRHAWMVVYDDSSWSRMFEYEYDAKAWASHAPSEAKVVKVTWEQ